MKSNDLDIGKADMVLINNANFALLILIELVGFYNNTHDLQINSWTQ